MEQQRSRDLELLARFDRNSRNPLSPYSSYYARRADALRGMMGA